MKKSDIGIIILAFIIGIPICLLFEHPEFFWIAFIPISLFGIIKFIIWLKK